MNESEIISVISSDEMPDIEKVRLNCISQRLPKRTRYIKVVLIAAILALITGATTLAVANRETITLFFEKVPERASFSEE